jgi:hypothetical protein
VAHARKSKAYIQTKRTSFIINFYVSTVKVALLNFKRTSSAVIFRYSLYLFWKSEVHLCLKYNTNLFQQLATEDVLIISFEGVGVG